MSIVNNCQYYFKCGKTSKCVHDRITIFATFHTFQELPTTFATFRTFQKLPYLLLFTHSRNYHICYFSHISGLLSKWVY